MVSIHKVPVIVLLNISVIYFIFRFKRGNCTCHLSQVSRPSHCLQHKDKQRRKPTPIVCMCISSCTTKKHRNHTYTKTQASTVTLSSYAVSKVAKFGNLEDKTSSKRLQKIFSFPSTFIIIDLVRKHSKDINLFIYFTVLYKIFP